MDKWRSFMIKSDPDKEGKVWPHHIGESYLSLTHEGQDMGHKILM